MKFDCSRDNFEAALSLAFPAVSQRSANVILQHLRLEAKDQSLTVTGCDGELWAERTVPAMVSEPGALCVQGKLLAELVPKLSAKSVTAETDSGGLCIRADGSDWRMNSLPAEEFPSLPTVTGQATLTLPMGEIRDMVGSVMFAVADDSSRPVLTGVLVTYDGSRLTFVATDTHRLAVKSVERPGIGSDVNAIVAEKALRAIRALPLGDQDEVTLQFDDSQLSVQAADCRIVAQLLAGTFPNWQRVVPQEFTRSWVVEREPLIENVNRSMILARDNANRVRFTGKNGHLLITTRSEERGEAREEVPAMTNNGELEIAFNGRYVLDAVSAFKDAGVKIELTESSRPAVFRPVEESENAFCVIMPMALG